MRILLADDQKEIRLLTAQQLERSGHHVLAVANGQEVLDALEREPFDVILLDEEMPVMNGLQALRAIRGREKELGRLTLIALTGYNTEPERERLLKAGFDSVLGKPFHLEALDALFSSSSVKALRESKKEPPSVPVLTPVANLLDRVGGDEKLAHRMIPTFLRNTRKRMADIHKAFEREDGESLASVAHALKGSVSIFGAQKARDHCQELQDLGRAKDFRGVAWIYEQLKEEIAELEANLRGYAGQKGSSRARGSPKSKRHSPSPKHNAP